MIQFLKRIAAVVLCVMLLVSSAMAEMMTVNEYSHKTSELIKAEDATKSDKIDINVITPVPGEEDNPSMEDSVDDLYSDLDPDEVGAAKNVDVEDVADGIVKVDLDVVYKPETVSVAFVLDRSGSMNMWVDKIDAMKPTYMYKPDDLRNVHVSTSNVPCMNPEHYYEINYTLKDGGENYVYHFYPVQNDASVMSWLSALNNKDNADDTDHGNDSFIEKEIERNHTNNEEVIITSIGRHMDSNGSKHDTSNDIHIDPIESSAKKPDYINTGFGYDNHFGFSSPKANLAEDFHDTNGDNCFDRSMLARHMIWQFVEKLYEANPDNQVAFTTFAGTSDPTYTQSFVTAADTAGKANLRHVILDDRGGAQYTNYTEGIKSAAKLFNISLDGTSSQSTATGKKIVVFVSDGSPSPMTEANEKWEDAVARADGDEEAAILRNDNNKVEIYAVGVDSGALHYLKKLATDENHARDCNTAQSFISFLNTIMDNVIQEKPVTITDILGDGYSLLIDEDHPVTLTNGDNEPDTMISLSELSAKGITYANNQISTTVNVSAKGCRLSFYAQLDDELCYPTGSGVKEHKTNKDMTYKVGTNDPVSIPVEDKLVVGHTVLTAIKDNGNMKDKAVNPGDIIPYTITVINSNGFDLTDLVVTDEIPEGTEYVTNPDGSEVYDEQAKTVSFAGGTIAAGTQKSFTFYVKVLPGFKDVVNQASFSVTEPVQNDPNNPDEPTRLTAQTNEVINPRVEIIPDVPQTGDSANPLVWALLAMLSLACITMMMNRKKA